LLIPLQVSIALFFAGIAILIFINDLMASKHAILKISDNSFFSVFWYHTIQCQDFGKHPTG
jgi:hypothetical protein